MNLNSEILSRINILSVQIENIKTMTKGILFWLSIILHFNCESPFYICKALWLTFVWLDGQNDRHVS